MSKKDITIITLTIGIVVLLGFLIIGSDDTELENLKSDYETLEKSNKELDDDYIKMSNDYFNLLGSTSDGKTLVNDCEIIRTLTFVSHIKVNDNVDNTENVVAVFTSFQDSHVVLNMTKVKYEEINFEVGKTYEVSLKGKHSEFENYNFDSMSTTYEVISATLTDKVGMDQIQESCSAN